MQNKIFTLVISSFILTSCGPETAPEIIETVEIKYVDNEIPPKDQFQYDTLQGMYTGDFAGSEIRVILNYVSGTNVIGYNIHKGLQRNINGKLTRSGDTVIMTLPEPGDHEFDGVFGITFIGIDKQPNATWTSNSGKIDSKNFKLKKLEAPKNDKQGINLSNFADHFGYLYDTLGSYTFESDGFCLFEYYPKTDDKNRVEQLTEVQGNWSLKGSTVTIDWQKNSVFPTETMILEVLKTEYEDYYLKGKSHELHYYYY